MSDKWKVLDKDTQERMKRVLELAGELERTTNIPRSITVAQWALESNWGRSELAIKAHNYFGMKATRGVWKGEVYNKLTKEQDRQGKEFVITAAFRKYPTQESCFKDRGSFLLRDRYKPCFDYPEGTPAHGKHKHFAKKLVECGYATDVKYADKLIQVIDTYDWNWYDFPKKKV